ncbi:MAG: hypothetical protein LW822_11170, partial [Phycisphaeraceae bacterium]|nr:hypothetical protein [Phycisphaeraceae bacterium]
MAGTLTTTGNTVSMTATGGAMTLNQIDTTNAGANPTGAAITLRTTGQTITTARLNNGTTGGLILDSTNSGSAPLGANVTTRSPGTAMRITSINSGTAGNIILDSTNSGTNPAGANIDATFTSYARLTTGSAGTGGALTLRQAGPWSINLATGLPPLSGANATFITSSGAMTLTGTGTAILPVTFQSAVDLTISGTFTSNVPGNAVVLASGQNFFNTTGIGAFNLTGGGRFLIYSIRPDQDTIGGLTGGRLYGNTYAGNPPASILAAGNQFLYSFGPVLQVTADPRTAVYGAGTPTLTYVITGVLPGDSYSGTPLLTTSGVNVGTYPIVASLGSLIPPPGYIVNYVNSTLSITPYLLSVAANPQSRAYGAADPTLTY